MSPRTKPRGTPHVDNLQHARRQIELMDRELRQLEHINDRYFNALRRIADTEAGGPGGQIALQALRPKGGPL